MRKGGLTFLLCCAICAIPACGRKILVYGSGGGSTFTQYKDAVIPVTGTKGEQASLKHVVPSVQAPKPGPTISVPPRRKAVLHLSSDSLNAYAYSPDARPKVEKARQLLKKAESLEQEASNKRDVWGYLALGGLIGFLMMPLYYAFNADDSNLINTFGLLTFFLTPVSFMVYLSKTFQHPVRFRKRASRLIGMAPKSSNDGNFFSDSVYALFTLREYLPARKLKRRLKRAKRFQRFNMDSSGTLLKTRPDVLNKLAILEGYSANRLKNERGRMTFRTLKYVGVCLLLIGILVGIAIGTMEFGIGFAL